MVDRAYTDAELEAAIAAIADPERLRAAQDLVARSAPTLHRVLATALEEGGWFDVGHNQAVREAAAHDDVGERVRAVRTMLAEETRLACWSASRSASSWPASWLASPATAERQTTEED